MHCGERASLGVGGRFKRSRHFKTGVREAGNERRDGGRGQARGIAVGERGGVGRSETRQEEGGGIVQGREGRDREREELDGERRDRD